MNDLDLESGPKVGTLAESVWEKMGQFSFPEVATEDPEGRRGLYIAGVLAGIGASAEARSELLGAARWMQIAVAKFMTDVKGLELPQGPIVPSRGISELCISLMEEELAETRTALRLAYDNAPWAEDAWALQEVADGIADLLYVTFYTANACGLDMLPLFAEVQRSNMAKLGGEKRPDGKQLKGPNYFPPDLLPLIRKQMSRQ